MAIKFRWRWNARRAGGLALGLWFHFPMSLCDTVQELEGTEEEHWQCVTFVVGLIVLSVYLDFEYGHFRTERWREMEPKE